MYTLYYIISLGCYYKDRYKALHWRVVPYAVYSYVPPQHYILCTYYYKRDGYNYYYDYYNLYCIDGVCPCAIGTYKVPFNV